MKILICPIHGNVPIDKQEEYRQLAMPGPWRCPIIEYDDCQNDDILCGEVCESEPERSERGNPRIA